MRSFLFVCFLFCCAALGAQVQKYHRVKIEVGKNGMMQLAAKGVAFDHGSHKPGHSFTGEFSDTELNIIKQSGFPFEVLITDMADYYVKRNSETNKAMSITACKTCPNYQTPANFTLGTMGGFYTYPELLNILDSMAAKYPNLISVRQPIDTGHTFEGRSVYYVKISDNPTVAEAEPQMLYTSLHHAREPESLTQLIFYMWYLLENYNSNAQVKYLVDNSEMYFIPCVNPDGYIYNHTTNPNGGGMWRKNRRNNNDGTYGVDLNRNYGYQWGYDNFGSSPNTNQDNYRGPSAFSESETQMVMRFCNAHTFQIALNNHTYDNVLVQPYGYAANTYTPDSTQFAEYGMRLTYCNEFGYGSAVQTVGYTANGVSDDWMYGEQSTKPKILAMTPEAGSLDDGFWPAQANIIPIAKATTDQNMYAARLVTSFAEVKDRTDAFIQQNGYITYNIKRLGMQAGNYTVSVAPLSLNFQSVGSPNTHNGMSLLQSNTDSISFSLINGLAPGTIIKYLVNVDNGGYTITDTATRVYGTPLTIFSDNCSTAGLWTGTAWGTSNKYAVSPSTSITDSPTGDYGSSWNKTFTTVSNINLTTAIAAYLEFYGRWEIEKNYDYVEIKASTNGVNFTSLCGHYSHSGNSYQDNGQPLYDGYQRTWVKERIDLSAYLGQSIKLRFNLVSDQGQEYDGFYFDDVTVRVLDTTSTGMAVQREPEISFYPNPASNRLHYTVPANGEIRQLELTDLLGRSLCIWPIPDGQTQGELTLPRLPAGTYLIKTRTNGVVTAKKLLLDQF